MLILATGRPAAKAVALSGGASIVLRTATSFEYSRVRTEVARLTDGLREAEDKAGYIATLFGDEFSETQFTRPDWIGAASEQLLRVKLLAICAESWSGVCEADDTPCELNEANLMRLLRDGDLADKLDAVLFAAVHEERAEKKGSAASPTGGAAAVTNSAPTAAPAATAAPTA